MGYSTHQIDIKKGLLLAKNKEVTSASDISYFNCEYWKNRIAKAEISDHNNPRIYFTLFNGDFVEVE